MNDAIDRQATSGSCPNCGGTIIGDGYTLVLHCEFADEDEVWCAEPDAPTIYCKPEESK